MLVYFIQGEKTKLVKIGRTIHECPHRRLSDLQMGSPDILRLLGVIYHFSESELHLKFKEDRFFGEWFFPSQSLLDFIENNAVMPFCHSEHCHWIEDAIELTLRQIETKREPPPRTKSSAPRKTAQSFVERVLPVVKHYPRWPCNHLKFSYQRGCTLCALRIRDHEKKLKNST